VNLFFKRLSPGHRAIFLSHIFCSKPQKVAAQGEMSESAVLFVGRGLTFEGFRRGLTFEGFRLDADPYADPLVIRNFKFSPAVEADMLHMSTEVITGNEAARLAFIQAKNRLESLVLLIKHEIVHLENELQEIIDEMKSGALTAGEIQAFSAPVAAKAQLISQKNRTFRAFQEELCDLGQEPSIIASSQTFVYHVPHAQPVDLILPDGEAQPVIFFKAGPRIEIRPEGPF
jgi:hypothetical protein